MKFGKLADITGVDFSFPTVPERTKTLLSGNHPAPAASPSFYIGATGWSMKEWIGTVYPANAKTKDFLVHYSKQFNTIELNTTHYRIPTLKTIQNWYDQSQSDFKFCPKIPQTISHSRTLGLDTDRILEFATSIQGLQEKLGCCFMQLPPHFKKDRLPLLVQFFEKWPNHLPLSIEFRHESWYQNQQLDPKTTETLQKAKIGTVITDVAGRRDVLHLNLTNKTAMIRFVGNGLHPTDYSRIKEWVELLEDWLKNGLQEVYFFPHEPDNILAPQLAAYLFEEIKNWSNIKTRGPQLIDPKTPKEGQQISLF